MAVQMVLRIDELLKKQFDRTARLEGKSQSVKVRELIGEYVEKNNMERYVDDLWTRIGNRVKKGFSAGDVSRVITEVRKRKRNGR